MSIAGYLESVSKIYDSGQPTDHSYRAALEGMVQSIDPDIQIGRNLTAAKRECPFLSQCDGMAFCWAEAKHLPKDVSSLKVAA